MNPILLEGEIGIVTDNPNQYKVGDGINTWNNLPLRGFTGTIAQVLGDDENAVVSQKVVTEKLSELGQEVCKQIKITANAQVSSPILIDGLNIKENTLIFIRVKSNDAVFSKIRIDLNNATINKEWLQNGEYMLFRNDVLITSIGVYAVSGYITQSGNLEVELLYGVSAASKIQDLEDSYCTNRVLNDSLYFLSIENKVEAINNGLCLKSIQTNYNAAYVADTEGSYLITLKNGFGFIDHEKYGRIEIGVKGVINFSLQQVVYNIGKRSYSTNSLFYAIKKNIFCKEDRINKRIEFLSIENKEAAINDGLYLRSIQGQYNAVYFRKRESLENEAVVLLTNNKGELYHKTYGYIFVKINNDGENVIAETTDNLGDGAFMFGDIVKQIKDIEGYPYCYEQSLNKLIRFLSIENKEAAINGGLYLRSIQCQYNAVYFRDIDSGDSTAVLINLFNNEGTYNHPIYGKIAVSIYNNGTNVIATTKDNIGEGAYNNQIASKAKRLLALEVPNRNIVCIGSSTTQGYNSEIVPNIASQVITPFKGGWVTKLEELTGCRTINAGVGGESPFTSLGRLGVYPMSIKESVVLPSSTEDVEVELVSSYDLQTKPFPLIQGSGLINPCYIQNIPCTLSISDNKYYVGRNTESNKEDIILSNTPIVTTLQREYMTSDNIYVLYTMANCELDTDVLIDMSKNAIMNLPNRNYLIIGIASIIGNNTLEVRKLQEIAYTKEFGARFVNLRQYMSEKAIYDAINRGYLTINSPTVKDLEDMNNGMTPTSLRVSENDVQHFNAVGYVLIAELIKDRMIMLNYL